MNYNPDNPVITYTSPSGRVLKLGPDADLRFGDTTLFDTALTYDEDTDEPTNYRRAARIAEMAVFVDAQTRATGAQARTTLERVLDDGATSGDYGMIEHDGWRIRALCSASNKAAWWFDARWLEADLSLVLPDGVWFRENLWQFKPEQRPESEDFLDFVFDYPIDFTRNRPPRRIDLDTPAACPWRMTIYGPATHPAVTIGGNRYEVDVVVPDGGYLVVDSREWSVEVVDMFGARVDAFDKRGRGTRGSGAYMWEPIRPGRSLVSWSETFGFDLVVYEECA